MRKKLLKLLRNIEKQQTFKDRFSSRIELYNPEDSSLGEYLEYQQKNNQEHLLSYDYEKILEDEEYHSVRSFLFYPNYELITVKYKNIYVKDFKYPPLYLDRSIKAELKRMETDKLITIDTQDVSEYALGDNGDFSTTLIGEGWKSKTESIILTTKGKFYIRYVWENLKENPIPIGISIISIIISILAFYKK